MRPEDFSRVLVFDPPSLRANFYPLTLTRPSFDLFCGTKTLLSSLQSVLRVDVTDLYVPEYLAATTLEQHQGKRVNVAVDERCLVLNALLRPDYPLASEVTKVAGRIRGDFLVTDRSGLPVFGVLEGITPESLGSKRFHSRLKRVDYEKLDANAIFGFPWEIVSLNSEIIQRQARVDVDHGANPTLVSRSRDCEVLGNGDIQIPESATVERYVTLDTRGGCVILDEDSVVESYSRITGPAYIGKASRVKSARVGKGTSVGAHCLLAGEVEDSIFFDYTNKSHDGFIGHSILGSWINLGAMTTNSDLKNTYGKIKVKLGSSRSFVTQMIKLGCFIGDMSKTAIGTSILSGKTIGVSAQVFGTVIEDVPSFTMYAKSMGAKSAEMYVESAVETQKRMMGRRKVEMSESYERMIRTVFRMTAVDRRTGHVKRGRFDLV